MGVFADEEEEEMRGLQTGVLYVTLVYWGGLLGMGLESFEGRDGLVRCDEGDSFDYLEFYFCFRIFYSRGLFGKGFR